MVLPFNRGTTVDPEEFLFDYLIPGERFPYPRDNPEDDNTLVVLINASGHYIQPRRAVWGDGRWRVTGYAPDWCQEYLIVDDYLNLPVPPGHAFYGVSAGAVQLYLPRSRDAGLPTG